MNKFKLYKPNSFARYLELVEVIGPNPNAENATYVRLTNGSKVTASEEQLFNIPSELIEKSSKPLKDIIKHQEVLAGSVAPRTAAYQIAMNALKSIEGK